MPGKVESENGRGAISFIFLEGDRLLEHPGFLNLSAVDRKFFARFDPVGSNHGFRVLAEKNQPARVEVIRQGTVIAGGALVDAAPGLSFIRSPEDTLLTPLSNNDVQEEFRRRSRLTK